MFKKVILLVLVVVAFSFAANAQSQSKTTKFDAWELGAELGVAAMMNAVGDTQTNIDKSFDKAVQDADKFGIKLPPLPAKTTVKKEYTRRLIDYFLDRAGHPTQKYLKANFSEEHAAAFDIGLVTNIYYFLQIAGDAEQTELYSPIFLFMIEDRTKAANLPVQTTEELVKLDGKKPTQEIIKKAVFSTISNVAQYLMKRDELEVGDGLLAQEKYNEAIIHYTRLIKYDPNFPETYFNRGVANYSLREYDSAIADFTKFISFADKNSYVANNLHLAYRNRCVNYYYKKDFIRAENDCTAAININKDFESAFYYRAYSRLEQGKFAETIEDFTKVIEMNPKAAVYYNRGVAYRKIGKEDLAKLDFEKAESLEPGIIEKLNAK